VWEVVLEELVVVKVDARVVLVVDLVVVVVRWELVFEEVVVVEVPVTTTHT